MTKAHRLIMRAFDWLGLVLESPFKLGEILFLPILGLIAVISVCFIIFRGLWSGIFPILVGMSFIAYFLIRKTRQ